MIIANIDAEQPLPAKCRRCPLLDRCIAAGARLCTARRTRAALSALDDAALKDVGLYRGDIARVVVENFR